MLFHALRRWLARHSASGARGLALGLTLVLCGAQALAVCHEIAHAQATADARDLHAKSSHGCPTCLVAAAIGGAATAPAAVMPHAPDATLGAPRQAASDYAPPVAVVYASRAPPGAVVTAA